MRFKVALIIIPLFTACAWQDDKPQPVNQTNNALEQPPASTATQTSSGTIENQSTQSQPLENKKEVKEPSQLALREPETTISAEIHVATPQAKPKPVNTAVVNAETEKQSTSSVIEQPKSVAIINNATVNGSVAFLQSSATKALPNDAIVTLTRLGKSTAVTKQPTLHTIDMTDKTYLPGAIAINTGDVLAFNNNDPIKHNVFSSSGDNTFDLGTYGFNTQRQQVINSNGVVKIYCNIHPEMALFVMANDGDFSAITDATGTFSFSNVPEGDYLLDVWHVRGAIDKKITVTAGAVLEEEIVIDTARYTPKPHLNKYGEPYKKQPAILSDEFY